MLLADLFRHLIINESANKWNSRHDSRGFTGLPLGSEVLSIGVEMSGNGKYLFQFDFCSFVFFSDAKSQIDLE